MVVMHAKLHCMNSDLGMQGTAASGYLSDMLAEMISCAVASKELNESASVGLAICMMTMTMIDA